MRISVIAAALAAVLWTPEAFGQSTLQRNDWQPKSFESYLPATSTSAPWLDLDGRTKLPKRDWPIGWQANAVAPFVLPRIPTDAQMSSFTVSDVRRM